MLFSQFVYCAKDKQESTTAISNSRETTKEVAKPINAGKGVVEEHELTPKRFSIATEAFNNVLNEQHLPKNKDYLLEKDFYLVSRNFLIVRRGPNKRYQRVRVLKRGTRIRAVGKRGQWLKIDKEEWVPLQALVPEP